MKLKYAFSAKSGAKPKYQAGTADPSDSMKFCWVEAEVSTGANFAHVKMQNPATDCQDGRMRLLEVFVTSYCDYNSGDT